MNSTANSYFMLLWLDNERKKKAKLFIDFYILRNKDI